MSRYILGALLAFAALNALAGGYYGLSGATDVPTDWLRGSPFRDYFVRIRPVSRVADVMGSAEYMSSSRWREHA